MAISKEERVPYNKRPPVGDLEFSPSSSMFKRIMAEVAAEVGSTKSSRTKTGGSGSAAQRLIDEVTKGIDQTEIYSKVKTGKATDADLEDFVTGKKQVSPELQGLFSQLLNTQSKARKKSGPSVMSRVFDVASRPLFAVTNVLENRTRMANKQKGLGKVGAFAPVGMPGDLGQIWQGLSGQDKVLTSDILKTGGMSKGKLRTILGFIGDIGLDPLTYATLGTSAAVKPAAKGALKVVEHSDDLIDVVKGARNISGSEKAIASGRAFSGKALTDAERALSTTENLAASRKIGKAAARDAEKEVLRNPKKLIPEVDMKAYREAGAGLTPNKQRAAYKRYLAKNHPEFKEILSDVSQSMADDVTADLIGNAQKILQTDQTKQLDLKMFGRKVGSVKTPEILAMAAKNTLTSTGASARLNAAQTSFDRVFRANSVGKTLSSIRGAKEGHAISQIEHMNAILARDFEFTVAPVAMRKAAYEALKHESGETILNKVGNDLVSLTKRELDDVFTPLKGFGDEGLAAWNSVVSKELQLTEKAFKSAEPWREVLEKFDDAGVMVAKIRHSAIQTQAQLGIFNSIKELGIDTAKLASSETNALVKAGFREPKIKEKLGNLLTGHMFPDDVAENIERLGGMLARGSERKTFETSLNKSTNMLKYVMTKVNPGYHMRNMTTGGFINTLDGTRPKHYGIAMSIVAHQTKMFDPDLMLHPNLVEEAKAAVGVSGKGTNTSFRWTAKGGTTRNISRAETWALFNKYGGRTNFLTSSEKILTPTSTKAGEILRHVDSRISHFSSMREDIERLSHAIALVQKDRVSKNLEEAFSKAMVRVRKMHGDYQNLTPFEKRYMSTALPFYKWQRVMLPVMAEMLFTKPAAYTLAPKAGGAISELLGFEREEGNWIPSPDAIMPTWLKDAGAFPVGDTGPHSTMYANPDFPTNKFLDQAQDPFRTVMGMTNPLVKGPFELATGHQVFSGAPTGGVMDYLLKQLPATGVAPRMEQQQSSGPLLSYLTGLGFTENTSKRQKGELQRLIKELNKKNKGP